MTLEEVKTIQKRQPFEPFRIVLKDGTKYDVAFPRSIWIDSVSVHVGFPPPKNADEYPIFEHRRLFDACVIDKVEPLETSL